MSTERPSQGSGESLAQILVVDDEEPLCRMLARTLERRGYGCRTAGSVEEARSQMESLEFDLLITDMNMEGESGLDLLIETKSRFPQTATIMVTGVDDPTFAEMAIRFGVFGYIIKPFEKNELLINVANALRRRSLELDRQDQMSLLESKVRERTSALTEAIAHLELTQEQLRDSREETIQRLAIAAEYRDNDTARHIERMSNHCVLLARSTGLDPQRCELIRTASLMHDVGKIGIPDRILLKPAGLTSEEFDIVKTHSMIGYRILSDSNSELLQLASTIALTHHERFDGTGYPRGAAGEDIPIEGRIAAIADMFDALTHDRVYRPGFSVEEAIEMMRAGRGTHFDPELLDLFLEDIGKLCLEDFEPATPKAEVG